MSLINPFQDKIMKTENKDLELILSKIDNLVENYCSISQKKESFNPGITPIPSSGKTINDKEVKNLVRASLDAWLTTGRFNKNFQEKLSKCLGIKNLITVNSGSSANLVAFSSLT